MSNNVTLGGNPIKIEGTFPVAGNTEPDLKLVAKDLSDVSLEAYAGLAARAVVVLDEQNRVLHSELVAEIKNEPNYADALSVLK